MPIQKNWNKITVSIERSVARNYLRLPLQHAANLLSPIRHSASCSVIPLSAPLLHPFPQPSPCCASLALMYIYVLNRHYLYGR